jgi:uncharacterized protein YaiE (UPF0345 family)
LRSIKNDIFTDTEIAEIYEYLKSIDDKKRFDFEGRTRLDFDNNFPSHLLNKIVSIANSKNSKLEYMSAYASEYNLKYGNPSLNPHFDTTQATYTIDYQLNSNIDWSIFIEGSKFNLKNNEAIEINVREEAHWRPQRKFSEGESTTMIFFHFLDRSNMPAIPTHQENAELMLKWDHLYSIWEN